MKLFYMMWIFKIPKAIWLLLWFHILKWYPIYSLYIKGKSMIEPCIGLWSSWCFSPSRNVLQSKHHKPIMPTITYSRLEEWILEMESIGIGNFKPLIHHHQPAAAGSVIIVRWSVNVRACKWIAYLMASIQRSRACEHLKYSNRNDNMNCGNLHSSGTVRAISNHDTT